MRDASNKGVRWVVMSASELSSVCDGVQEVA